MTILLIAITALFSILAFKQPDLTYRFQFNPYQILKRKQYARWVLHGFLHANWTHLIINMLVLYSFGLALENHFQQFFGNRAIPYFLLLYLGAILVSPIYSLYKNRTNYHYNAVGASGAVSAVIFAAIFFDPWNKIYFFGLVPVPGIVFAALYLIYSFVMSKRSSDNIAHDTHFFGAVFGFIFPLLLEPSLFSFFIRQLTGN